MASNIPSIQRVSTSNDGSIHDSNPNLPPYRHNKVKDWPTNPRALTRRPQKYVLVVLNLVVALLFLGLSIASLCINGRPVPSTAGIVIQQVSHIGPSIFPVIFTSLMSYAFESIGHLYSERSITLNELRFFLTTRNTSDAIHALKDIRRMSPLILVSVLVWALSPVGGQASLRIITTTNQSTNTTGIARYLDTGPLRHHFVHSLLKVKDEDIPVVADAELFTAINQPDNIHDSPTDIWGNFKIPRIDMLEAGLPGDWISTANIRGADSYTSLIGIPIHDLPLTGTKDLQVETSYMVLDCSPLKAPESFGQGDAGLTQVLVSCPGCPLWNTTNPSDLCKTRPVHPWCKRLAAFLGLGNTKQDEPMDANSIAVDIWTNENPKKPQDSRSGGLSTNCVITERRVELHVRCDDRGCYSEAMRLSQTDNRPANATSFDYWSTYHLSDRILLHSNPGDVINYLIKPNNQSHFEKLDIGNISSMTRQLFSLRLGAIVNTYIQIYLSALQIRPKQSSAFDWGPKFRPSDGLRFLTQSPDLSQINDQFWENLTHPHPVLWSYAATNVTTSSSVEVYQTATIWAIILLVCSLTLLCIGIMGILCDSQSLAPKRFDPVLGQTFDNPEFGLEGGTTLDVDDRLRLLGQLKVQVGDVRKGWDVGRIGFALKENVVPLQLGRLYE